MKGIVDADSLEQQITDAFGSYMKGAVFLVMRRPRTAIERQITSAMEQVMNQMAEGLQFSVGQAMTQIGSSLQNAMHVDEDAFAEAFQMNMTGEELAELMMSMGAAKNATYDNNLKQLGYVDFAVPTTISIYPKDFESKEEVVRILDDYNKKNGRTRKRRTGYHIYGYGRRADVVCDTDHRRYQLCARCVCSDFPYRIIDHDRCDHLYQCS